MYMSLESQLEKLCFDTVMYQTRTLGECNAK